MSKGKDGFYCKYVKRALDIVCSSAMMLCLCWLYGAIAALVRIKLGSPVIFVQNRPGKDDKTFQLYKFRTMTDEKDESGNLLPDDVRLTPFGKRLRDSSLDELPEAWNILRGDMSIVGPRPQLVRDMVFMTDDQRRRHSVRPGLTGWAQVNGRNCIEWEDKLQYDLEYLDRISLWEDLKILLITVEKVIKTESISYKGMATAEDYGDYLLRTGKIDRAFYDQKQAEAAKILNR